MKYNVGDILVDKTYSTTKYKVIDRKLSTRRYEIEYITEAAIPNIWFDCDGVEDSTKLYTSAGFGTKALNKYNVGDVIRDGSKSQYKIISVDIDGSQYELESYTTGKIFFSTFRECEQFSELVTTADQMRGQCTANYVPDSLYCQCVHPTIKQVLVGVVTTDKYDYCTTCKKEKL